MLCTDSCTGKAWIQHFLWIMGLEQPVSLFWVGSWFSSGSSWFFQTGLGGLSFCAKKWSSDSQPKQPHPSVLEN